MRKAPRHRPGRCASIIVSKPYGMLPPGQALGVKILPAVRAARGRETRIPIEIDSARMALCRYSRSARRHEDFVFLWQIGRPTIRPCERREVATFGVRRRGPLRTFAARYRGTLIESKIGVFHDSTTPTGEAFGVCAKRWMEKLPERSNSQGCTNEPRARPSRTSRALCVPLALRPRIE